MMMRRAGGVITVYACLILVLILTLTGVLVQSAAVQTSKNRAKADTSLAIESLFAEYDPDLMEHYHIFAADCGRGGGGSESYALRRMRFYGADTNGASVRRVQYLSDDGGKAYYEQALRWMEEKEVPPGAGAADRRAAEAQKMKEEIEDARKEAETQTEQMTLYAGRMESARDAEGNQTDESTESEGSTMPGDDGAEADVPGGTEAWRNFFGAFTDLAGMTLPEGIMPQGRSVSAGEISTAGTASNRPLQSGKGSFTYSAGALAGSAAGTFVYDAYLMEVMACEVREPQHETALEYEIEYILSGRGSDRDNLKETVQKLLLIRTAMNRACLSRDAGRQTAVRAAAAFLALAMGMPEAQPAVEKALIYAWAYGESVMEVRALLDGKKVPASKTPENWKLSIGGLLLMVASPFAAPGQDVSGWEAPSEEEGLSYEDYLRIFLAAEPRRKKVMRALDLIELNIGLMRSGGSAMKSDRCVCRLEVESSCALERGVRYRFATAFAYR